jgi:long-chain acyl-CoA synthetase
VALGNPFYPTRKPGTVGIPFPSTLMKVTDIDDPTVEVPHGQPGELMLKGPQVLQGYWNNPEETAKTLTPDRWLRTGDIVTVDEDGFSTIVDRAKDLIITGGFNVAPTEVETVLRLHASVVDAAVFGKTLERGGEMVVAAVELEPGATLDEKALQDHCREHLAAYKIPRRIVQITDTPRTMLGKVLRRKVREQVLPTL